MTDAVSVLLAHFTSAAFIERLHAYAIQTSMEGYACWRDNIFVERLCCSHRYDEVFLTICASVSAAKAGIARYFKRHYSRRPHSSAIDRTSDDAYVCPLPLQTAA